MRPIRTAAAACLLAGALACANDRGPAYPDFAATAPPIAPGRARLVVYRPLLTPPEGFYAQISVDGAAAGTLPAGTWLWVDEPAGLHRVDSPPWPAYASFGEQLPTQAVMLELPPGTTSFVAVSVRSDAPLLVGLQPIAPDQARSDLATLELAPPADDLQ